MNSTSENKPGNNICTGLLAHVDAGKTTLSEAILYISGKLRKLGRVDNQNAYLDTNAIERERGITIFFWRAGDYAFRYARACRLFGGDGENPAGDGLCCFACQRCGWRARAYDDFVAAFGALSDSRFFICQ